MNDALNDSWPQPDLVIRVIDHPIEVWSQVHGWIDRALDQPLSLVTGADVFNEIMRKHMTLWCIYRHGVVVAAFVTKIESGTRGRALNIIAVGGHGMDDWIESFGHTVTIYAREHHCRYIFEMGRRGWIRVFGKLGWVDGPATMVKVL